MASTTSFKQQCPSCEAMVPIRDPGLIGRKIDCPKCKYRFVVEKPKGKAKGDDDDSAGDTPAPTKKAKKSEGVSTDTRVPAKKVKKLDPAAKSDKVVAGKLRTKSAARLRDEDDEGEYDRPRKKQSGASLTVIIGAILGGLALVLLIICCLSWMGVFGGKSDSSSSQTNNSGPGGTGPQVQKPGPGGNPGNNPGAAGARSSPTSPTCCPTTPKPSLVTRSLNSTTAPWARRPFRPASSARRRSRTRSASPCTPRAAGAWSAC